VLKRIDKAIAAARKSASGKAKGDPKAQKEMLNFLDDLRDRLKKRCLIMTGSGSFERVPKLKPKSKPKPKPKIT
jgi:hypothetical protein